MSDDPHHIYYTPIDADELKKMKEQERDNLHKSRQSYVDAINERRTKSLQYSKDYGEAFIKNIVLLNGGSIIAVLTLVGSLYGKGDHTLTLIAISLVKCLVPALYCFGVGLCSAAIAAACGYLNFGFIAGVHTSPENLHNFAIGLPITEQNKPSQKWITLTAWGGVICAFISLSCFVAGAIQVARSFVVLGVS